MAHASPEADRAVSDLIHRIAPEQATKFTVDTSLPTAEGKDVFSVSDGPDGKIRLAGNNGVSVASAFNWYLKNRANCHVSWCGDQLTFPAELPKVGEAVTVASPLKYRVYFNYCTLSYSASWWNWERWQREIDFMAMNGINMPLSVVGLENVWYETLLAHGWTDEEARKFLSGPAFFAWQWMTNLEAHCGPLPKSWLERSRDLGRKVIDRQRELGMTPIQQGFTGHVPRLTKEKFPKAKISFKSHWVGFPGAAQLDPLDPLFDKIGKTFLEKQKELFGQSHYYGCDPFHEGEPPSEDAAYLQAVGKKLESLITSVDPQGKIAMQSWSLREEIATAIPKEKLLILDLAGHKHRATENFWGYEFVTGRLHNFGGRTKMHGDMRGLAANPFAALAQSIPNCKGGGFFMEGIIQNPAYYDLAFDQLWKTGKVDAGDWLKAYARRRYGADSANAENAWQILLETSYKTGTDGVEASSMVCARPAISPKKSGPNNGFSIPFPQERQLEAWRLLLADADKLKASEGYRYDVVDVGREVLDNYAQLVQPKMRDAWWKRDLAAFDAAWKEFEQLLLDIDELVGSRTEYRLSKWIADARSHGNTAEEKNLYEKNARTMVSIWGPSTDDGKEVRIFDYSWREWNGLIRDFYLPRWKQHTEMLRAHLVAGTEYSEDDLPLMHGRETFRANDFFKKLAEWEVNWAATPGPAVDPAPQGDEIELSRRMFDRYAEKITAAVKAKQTMEAVVGKEIGKWPLGADSGTAIEISVTDQIDGEGTYAVTIRVPAAERVKLARVELLEGGKVISTDEHPGHAGPEHRANTYKVALKNHAFGTKYTIRCTLAVPYSGKAITGTVFMNRMHE